MSGYPKWDYEKYPYTSDYITQLFRANYKPPEVYWAVSRYFVLENKSERQALADAIAILYTRNIDAQMSIPIKQEI